MSEPVKPDDIGPAWAAYQNVLLKSLLDRVSAPFTRQLFDNSARLRLASAVNAALHDHLRRDGNLLHVDVVEGRDYRMEERESAGVIHQLTVLGGLESHDPPDSSRAVRPSRRCTEGWRVMEPGGLDDQADRIHDRRGALLFYVEHELSIVAVQRGFDRATVVQSVLRPDEVSVRAFARDGREYAMTVDVSVLRSIADEHATPYPSRAEILAEIGAALKVRTPREYVPRWIGEKRAAAEIAAIVGQSIPRIEAPTPPRRATPLETLDEFHARGGRKTIKVINNVGSDGRMTQSLDRRSE